MADDVLIPAGELRARVAAVFRALGVPADQAAVGADVLVTADLRGVSSHGVALLPKYVAWYRRGEIEPDPRWRVVRETAATANVDAGRGLGVMLAPRAMDLAIGKARDTGIGLVTLRNGRHLGMAGYHAMLALRHDMIGICLTASPPFMVPPGGRVPAIGSNPIAVAVPGGEHPPFVFDAAMTVAAGHRVGEARRSGALLPGGLVADEEGRPVLHAAPAPAETRLLPIGATPELGAHKGFGLALVVEILAGVLSGSGFAARHGVDVANHVLAAVDVASFTPLDGFRATMDELLGTLEALPPAAGASGVRIPGAASARISQERKERGIPVTADVLALLERPAPA
jgi:LDH2 family malate/lactate/ureidoglycolate dehydrogenase